MTNIAVAKEEHKDVFYALFDLWKRTKNPARKIRLGQILFYAKQRQREIDQIRQQRHIQKLMCEQRGNINGNLVTGDIHELEYAACEILCPAIKHGTGPALTEGWRWIIKQPWGKDFSAAPIEKRHSHV